MALMEIKDEWTERVRNLLEELEKTEKNNKAYEENYSKIVDFWNRSINDINKNVSENKEFDKFLDEHGFKWSQLVWQEIDMWARLNEPVSKWEFEYICGTRGFNQKQKEFLTEALELIGLNGTNKVIIAEKGERKMEEKMTKEDMAEISEQLKQVSNDPNLTMSCHSFDNDQPQQPPTIGSYDKVRISAKPRQEKKRCTSLKDVVSYFAKWAVSQSPYFCPDNLEDVVKYLYTQLKEKYEWKNLGGDFIYLYLTPREVMDMLKATLDGYEPFMKWNAPKKGSHTIMFVSAYDGPRNPDYDFIDLSCLYSNTARSIMLDDERENDKI